MIGRVVQLHCARAQKYLGLLSDKTLGKPPISVTPVAACTCKFLFWLYGYWYVHEHSNITAFLLFLILFGWEDEIRATLLTVKDNNSWSISIFLVECFLFIFLHSGSLFVHLSPAVGNEDFLAFSFFCVTFWKFTENPLDSWMET